MSGYDLGLTIRHSVGHFWNESYGQIYPNLKKLANEGFVSCKTKQKGKPDRRIYSITEKGRERLTPSTGRDCETVVYKVRFTYTYYTDRRESPTPAFSGLRTTSLSLPFFNDLTSQSGQVFVTTL
jgi:hypothetical protein